jgi:AcrR family transcriptional regulator
MSIVDLVTERRPHRADAARNFDAILAAASESFAETGIDASLEDIAGRAGVGVATLYRNFPTREDLVESVYVAEVAAVCAFADEVEELEPWERLETWLDRFVVYLGTKRALVDGLNRESTTFRACRDALYETGEPLLVQAQQAGVVSAITDIDDLMRLVFALSGGIYRDEDQRSRILKMALGGIRAFSDGVERVSRS